MSAIFCSSIVIKILHNDKNHTNLASIWENIAQYNVTNYTVDVDELKKLKYINIIIYNIYNNITLNETLNTHKAANWSVV